MIRMMADQIPLITIDGPSGSGKGTLASLLSTRLGYRLLDSGAIYRVLAVAAKNRAISFDDQDALVVLAQNLDVVFTIKNTKRIILLDDKDVSSVIRTETVGANASKVAALPLVRDALLQRQRVFLASPGLIADGRDMGTVVFPKAPLKLFLTASAEERAKRRFEQLKAAGENVTLGSLIDEIKARDERDTSRTVAPLVPATDAVMIDSTGMDINQVLEKVLCEVAKLRIFDK